VSVVRFLPSVYSVPSEKTSPRFCRAFAEGCGAGVVTDDRLRPGPVALFGSPSRWDLLQRAFREGRTVYYGDHGYFGRERYYRITKNAYQHDGSGTSDGKRFSAFGRTIQPWQKDGRHVLVCPNSATYFRLFGLDVFQWVQHVSDTIAGVSQRPIRVRWKGDAQPIESDLKDCWAVVAFSSAAALDALMAGVPVFVLADFAAAFRFGLPWVEQIDSPIYPEGREQLLWNLADHQWTLDEIRHGDAWRAIQ
jgi:hypothetical protein